ncbi:hypothetical protein BT69DRAFT_1323433 [Atractiella rhizophila]|nr:hypothetical protein BT69DRAFT_1323433 [Atractiella rhizophila]
MATTATVTDASVGSNVCLPPLLGTFVSCILLGFLFPLLTRFYQLYPRENNLWLRVFVTSVVALEIIQTVCEIVKRARVSVAYGDLDATFQSRPEDAISSFLIAFIQAACQLFLLQRSFLFARLRKTWILRTVLALELFFIVEALAAGCVTSAQVAIVEDIRELSLPDPGTGRMGHGHLFRLFSRIWLISSAKIDVVLSILLIYELYTTKKSIRDRNAETAKIVNRLLLLVVESGVLILGVQIFAGTVWIIELSSHMSPMWGYFPLVFLSKCYSITLLYYLVTSRAEPSHHHHTHVSPDPRSAAELMRTEDYSPWGTNSISTLVASRTGYSLSKQRDSTGYTLTKQRSPGSARWPNNGYPQSENFGMGLGITSYLPPGSKAPSMQKSRSRPGTGDSQTPLTPIAEINESRSKSPSSMPTEGRSQRAVSTREELMPEPAARASTSTITHPIFDGRSNSLSADQLRLDSVPTFRPPPEQVLSSKWSVSTPSLHDAAPPPEFVLSSKWSVTTHEHEVVPRSKWSETTCSQNGTSQSPSLDTPVNSKPPSLDLEHAVNVDAPFLHFDSASGSEVSSRPRVPAIPPAFRGSFLDLRPSVESLKSLKSFKRKSQASHPSPVPSPILEEQEEKRYSSFSFGPTDYGRKASDASFFTAASHETDVGRRGSSIKKTASFTSDASVLTSLTHNTFGPSGPSGI